MVVKKTAASLLSLLVLASIGTAIHADPTVQGGAPNAAEQPAAAPAAPVVAAPAPATPALASPKAASDPLDGRR